MSEPSPRGNENDRSVIQVSGFVNNTIDYFLTFEQTILHNSALGRGPRRTPRGRELISK